MTAPIGYPEQFGAILRQQTAFAQAKELGAHATSHADKMTGSPSPLSEKPASLAPSFAEQLAQFVGEVVSAQKTADYKADEFAAGRNNDIHGTMIADEQADIAVRLLVNVRNRAVGIYQEMMRMGS